MAKVRARATTPSISVPRLQPSLQPSPLMASPLLSTLLRLPADPAGFRSCPPYGLERMFCNCFAPAAEPPVQSPAYAAAQLTSAPGAPMLELAVSRWCPRRDDLNVNT